MGCRISLSRRLRQTGGLGQTLQFEDDWGTDLRLNASMRCNTMFEPDASLNAALKALAQDVRRKAPATGSLQLGPEERLSRMQRIAALADKVEQLADHTPDPQAEEHFEAILRELGGVGAFPDGSLVVAAAFAF
jgi:hypothetical protein